MSSGDVSSLTNIKSFSPASCCLTASSAVNTTLPVAAPGEAAKPFAITFAAFSFSSLNTGCNNCSNWFGSTLKTASFSVIMPSFTKSTAILKAAVAVLLPFLVCKKYNFPLSIVNSMSCISL